MNMATLEPQENGDLLVVWDQDAFDSDDLHFLGNQDQLTFWHEVLEYYLCNGYEAVLPENVGALTDAFILRYDDTFWWDANYQVSNPWEHMQANKPYRLQRA